MGVAAATLATRTGADLHAQAAGQPFATLSPAPALSLAGDADSNSPAVWELFRGQPVLFVLTSVAGQAQNSVGPSLDRLRALPHVAFSTAAPLGGFWIESVIEAGGVWYGYYHNEVADLVCPGSGKVVPRIGAARSTDRGRTWADLGTILEAPLSTMQCNTRNHYFHGGVGDFSAVLDRDEQYLYFHYTQYLEQDGWLGVSVARMPWADRDAPVGRMTVWHNGAWLPARPEVVREPDDDEEEGEGGGEIIVESWIYPFATPVHAAVDRWDNRTSAVDVYWGAAVHWNTALGVYVMLLNRAISNDWKQGGIYISYNPDVEDPAGWSRPTLLLNGGRWYPQVMGLTPGEGTDKVAGATARFFMSGRSEHLIRFGRR
ncbi:MAG: hypothetical protein AB1635_17295 [Acidobacteriota bacterium]